MTDDALKPDGGQEMKTAMDVVEECPYYARLDGIV